MDAEFAVVCDEGPSFDCFGYFGCFTQSSVSIRVAAQACRGVGSARLVCCSQSAKTRNPARYVRSVRSLLIPASRKNMTISANGSASGIIRPVRGSVLCCMRVMIFIILKLIHIIKSIMNKTGAKVIVSREADSNGCCNVAITGSGEAVEKAAQLVVDASLGANGSNGHAATEEVSLLSELTGDDLVQSNPTVVTRTPVEGEHDLLAFLHKHKSSSLDKGGSRSEGKGRIRQLP